MIPCNWSVALRNSLEQTNRSNLLKMLYDHKYPQVRGFVYKLQKKVLRMIYVVRVAWSKKNVREHQPILNPVQQSNNYFSECSTSRQPFFNQLLTDFLEYDALLYIR